LGQYPGMVSEKFIKLGSNCYNLNMRADQGFKVLPLLALSLSFTAGIWLASFLTKPIAVWLVLAGAGLLLLVVSFFIF
jgi:hypothetical protein